MYYEADYINELLETNNIGFLELGDIKNYLEETNLLSLTETVHILYEESEKSKQATLGPHEQRLRNAGFDIKRFKSDLKNDMEKVASSFSSIKINDKQAKEKLNSFTSKMKEIAKTYAKKAGNYFADREKMEKLGKDVAISFIMFVIVVTINTGIMMILNTVFPFGLGNTIGMTITGPLCEELFKRLATKFGIGNTYNVVFNICEASTCIQRFLSIGISLPKAILARIPAIIMHTINQRIINKVGEKETDEKIKNKKKNLVIILTFAIHAAFNFAGIKSNDVIEKFLTKDLL